MEKTKLGQILFSLDPNTRKDFVKFAGLSCFHLQPDCLGWLEELRKQGSAWSSENSAFQAAWKKNRYKWATQVLRAFRHYIQAFMIEPDSYEARFSFLRKASEFRWVKSLKYDVGQLTDELEAEHQRDHSFHWYELLLAEQQLIQTKHEKGPTDFLTLLAAALRANESAYLETRLRLLLEQFNRSRLHPEVSPPDISREEVEALLEHSSSGVRAYAGIFQMLIEGSQEDRAYQITRDLIESRVHLWHPDLIKPLVVYLMNHCLRRFNGGDPEFAQAYLDWIGWSEQHKLLLEQNCLSFQTFRNAISAALLVGDMPQVEELLDHYGSLVEPMFQLSSTEIAQAKIAFHQQKYQAVRDLIGVIKPPPRAYILQVDQYRLDLKTYLEDPNEEDFDRKIKNMKQYVSRSQDLSPPEKNRLLAFCKTCEWLGPGQRLSAAKWKKLKETLIPQAPLSDQAWLRAQVAKRGEA